MTLFLVTLLSLFSLSAFSQGSDKGGHDGSGGNICFVKDYTSCKKGNCTTFTGYRLVEEIQYPHFSSLPSFVKYNPKRLTLSVSNINPKVSITDLTLTKAGNRARKSFIKAFAFDLDLAAYMLELYRMLEMTYVIQQKFGRALDVGLEVKSVCEPSSIEAAIRTNKDGVIILSEKAWHRLPVESQQALIIHETLRFAQLYTTWFKDISNQELQKITMLVVQNKNNQLKKHSFYKKFQFEREFFRTPWTREYEMIYTLACKNYEDLCEREITPHYLSKNSILKTLDLTFKSSVIDQKYSLAIQKLLLKANLKKDQSNRYELEELSRMRIHSTLYRSDIEQQIVEEFALQ